MLVERFTQEHRIDFHCRELYIRVDLLSIVDESGSSRSYKKTELIVETSIVKVDEKVR